MEREISANVPSSGEKELLLNTKKNVFRKKITTKRHALTEEQKNPLYTIYDAPFRCRCQEI